MLKQHQTLLQNYQIIEFSLKYEQRSTHRWESFFTFRISQDMCCVYYIDMSTASTTSTNFNRRSINTYNFIHFLGHFFSTSRLWHIRMLSISVLNGFNFGWWEALNFDFLQRLMNTKILRFRLSKQITWCNLVKFNRQLRKGWHYTYHRQLIIICVFYQLGLKLLIPP